MKPVEIEFLLRDKLSPGIDNARVRADLLDASLKRIGIVAGSVFSAQKAIEFGKTIMAVREEIESFQLSFNALLGNKEKANTFFLGLKEFANNTGLALDNLSKAAQMMLGFGVESEKIIPTLKQIGDITMGNSERFNSMTLAFSQMWATGKLMGQDLLQMVNAGFNPLIVMTEKTGKSMSELKKEMSEGTISAEMVAEAFATATAEGGQFYKMLEEQSKGIRGVRAEWDAVLQDTLNKLGSQSQELYTSSLKMATELLRNYEKMGRVLISLITTYGAYRAAVLVATTAARGWTAAELLHYNALLLVDKGYKLLNATMLKNPAVLLATVIMGVVTAMWALKDSTYGAREAQERLNREKEEAIRREDDHKQKIENLVSVAQNESAATEDRKTALIRLEKQYPAIFSKYDTEAEKLNNILEIKRAINEADGIKKTQNQKEELLSVEKEIATLEKMEKVQTFDQNGRRLPLTTQQYERLAYLRLKREGLSEEINRQSGDEALSKLTGYSNRTLENEIKKREELLAKMQLSESKYGVVRGGIAGGKKSGTELQGEIQILNSELEKRNEKTNTPQEWVAARKKAYEDALKDLKEYEAGKDKVSEDAYEKEHKRLSTIVKKKKEEYEDYGGKTSSQLSKEESTAEKEKKEANRIRVETAQRERQIEEQARQIKNREIQAQLEIDQAKLDTMDEGFRKQQKQIELNARKAQQENKLREQEFISEAQKSEELAFEKDNPKYKEKGIIFTPKTKKRGDLPGEQKKLLDAYDAVSIIEREKAEKDLSDSLLKIYQSYTDRRTAIEKKYGEDIAALKVEREKAEKKGDTKKAEQIDRSIKEAEKGEKEEISKLDLEKFKKDIDWEGVFGDLDMVSSSYMKKLRERISTYLKTMSGQLSPESIKTLQDAITKMDEKITETSPIDTAKTAWDNYKKSIDKVREAKEKLSKSSSDSERKAADKELQDAQNDRRKSLKEYSNSVNSMADKASQVLNAGNEIMDMLGNLGVEIPESLKGIMNGLGQIVGGLESIDLTKPFSVISSTASIISGIGNTFAGIFGGGSNELSQKAIDTYNTYISVMSEMISKQEELIRTSAGSTAVTNTQKAIDLAYEQIRATRQMGRDLLNSGSGGGSHSRGYDLRKALWAYHEDFERATGLSYDLLDGRATAIFDLTAEKLAKWKAEASLSWAQLDEDTRNYLNSIIEGHEKIDDLLKSEREILAGFSLEDAKNEIKSFLLDVDASEKDVANNFEEYMTNSIANIVTKNKMAEKIGKWYEEFSSAFGSDEVSKEKRQELQDSYAKIVKEAKDEFNNLLDTMGINLTSTTRQEGRRGSFETMTQDQGTKLEGLFTSLQMHVSSISGSIENVATTLSAALDHLKMIAENTSFCKILPTIAEDIRIIKRDGIKIK